MPFDASDMIAARRLAQALPDLARAEAELLRKDLGARRRALATGACLGVIGAVLSLTALDMLAGAAATALIAEGLSPIEAALIVAGVAGAIAALTLWLGLRGLSTATAPPRRLARSLRRDFDLMKETLR